MSAGNSDKIGGWLDGFLARRRPRKELAGHSCAADQERLLLHRILLRGAPEQGLDDWLDDLEVELATRCYGTFWPTPDVVHAAVAAANERRPAPDQNPTAHEDIIVNRMAQFFSKTGAELPSFGRPDRTAALIARGVLESESDARFRNFTLSDRQVVLAKTQPPSTAEFEHHARWLAHHHDLDWEAAVSMAQSDFRLRRDQSDTGEPASEEEWSVS